MRPAEQALDHGGKVPLEEQGRLTMVVNCTCGARSLDHGGKVRLAEQALYHGDEVPTLRSRHVSTVVKFALRSKVT